MEMKVRWKDGREEPAFALKATTGLGLGDLVSKVMVKRGEAFEFIPLHLAEYVEVRSFGESHIIRESQPVTINLMQR